MNYYSRKRPNNIKISFVFIIVSTLLFGCKTQKEPTKKNVLFILADDLGYYDLSYTGSNYYETPNIDKIASEGMVFTNGYATCQVCSPSRASIITGKFPARHGITDWIGAKTGTDWRSQGRFNKLLPANYTHVLNKEYTTLPEALKEAGYKTFFAGKWHIGDKGSWPEDHGFDINIAGCENGYPDGGYFSPFNNPNLKNVEVGENLSMRLAKETSEFIEQNKDSSFFAYLSFYAVHGPIETTEEKWMKYRKKADSIGIAEPGFKMEKYLPFRQVQDNPVYAGLVESMDDAVGHVLNTLKKLHLDKNTIVIFTSDNGGVAAGDAFATSTKPFRAGKGSQYEGGIREPYFIKVPWLNNAGLECSIPVTGTDFYPTILDLIDADLKPEEHTDGVSLLPLLEGNKIAERPLIWHYPHYGNQGGEPSSIIREGNWKLIHYYEDNRKELYNMNNDWQETINVAKDNPELVKSLSSKLFTYLNKVNAKYPEKDPEYKAELEREYLNSIENIHMPRLEKQRMLFLSEDFNPGNNWWGSKITFD